MDRLHPDRDHTAFYPDRPAGFLGCDPPEDVVQKIFFPFLIIFAAAAIALFVFNVLLRNPGDNNAGSTKFSGHEMKSRVKGKCFKIFRAYVR